MLRRRNIFVFTLTLAALLPATSALVQVWLRPLGPGGRVAVLNLTNYVGLPETKTFSQIYTLGAQINAGWATLTIPHFK